MLSRVKRIKSFWSIFDSNAYSQIELFAVSSFCRRSYGVPTAACRQQQQQQRGRGRGRGQSGASSDDVSSVGISNGGSCISLWRLRWNVSYGDTHAWGLRTGAVWTHNAFV